jgi:dTDP-4-amino-4,6-dideoxygalactose transaminase
MRSPTASLFPAYPKADYLHHAPQIMAAMRRVSESGRYILGPEVEAFEREFAHYLGVDHVVGVASGTDAIEIMLRALGITQGVKVVVPSLTAVAVAAGVTRAGAELVLADCEPDTLTMCPRSLRTLLQSPDGHRIKAALVVHLYGQPANWQRLQEVADEHGILLLEDAAQAHGAQWQGRKVGTLGRAAAFSFYPTKNLGAMGDAGAVVTQDADLAERVRLIRQYGWKTPQISECTGVNSRLDELQAAILRAKLPSLESHLAKRATLAAIYAGRLAGVTLPRVRRDCRHAWHLHVVRSANRDAMLRHLQSLGIPATVHYGCGIHQQPAYATGQSLPVTEKVVKKILTLPLHPYLSHEAVEFVCDAVEQCQPLLCHASLPA